MKQDRRDPGRDRILVGGRRESDPPLTPRACADWMGVSPSYIRGLIHDKHLRAEKVVVGDRRPLYRIYFDDFVKCLKRLNWSRLPRAGEDRLL